MKYCKDRDVTSVYSLNSRKLPGRFSYVDSTDANIVETSTCLETIQHETTHFTVQLLIGWPWSVFSCAPEQKKDWEMEGSWGIVSMLKSLQMQLQRRHRQQCLTIDTYPMIDFFQMVILSLLVWVLFLVHQVLHTVYLRYRLVVSPRVCTVFPPHLSVWLYPDC